MTPIALAHLSPQVATAHGNKLADVLKSPDLQDLMGGIVTATLGDEAAKKWVGGQAGRRASGRACVCGRGVHMLCWPAAVSRRLMAPRRVPLALWLSYDCLYAISYGCPNLGPNAAV